MAWENTKPDLKNNPAYLEPRVTELENRTTDMDTLKNIEDVTTGSKWVWKLNNGSLYLEQVE